MTHRKTNRPKVLALSSGGGHWVQLLRLRPAFENCDVVFATVSRDYEPEVEGKPFRAIVDSNRDQKLRLIGSLLSIAWTIVRVRPDAIISTGAAPGFFAIWLGKLLGKRTVWIDSIANAEELSLSGQKAGQHATLWLTQWSHLAKPDGPQFFGNILGDAEESNLESTIPVAAVETAESTARLQPGTTRSADSVGAAATAEPSADGHDHSNPIRIFVTVGTDQHFNRMVKIIDDWAGETGRTDIFAQIGETDWKPKNLRFAKFLRPQEFVETVSSAQLIIGHAGMGTILTALRHRKPVLVMPKLASLGEHRNEHQSATAKHLEKTGYIEVAYDEAQLRGKLIALNDNTRPSRTLSKFASPALVRGLAAFLLEGKPMDESNSTAEESKSAISA